MIRFNLIGIVMLFTCAAIALIATEILNDRLLATTGGLTLMLLLDLAYRLRSNVTGREKWLGSRSGGFLGITPVWITALLLIGLLQAGLLEF